MEECAADPNLADMSACSRRTRGVWFINGMYNRHDAFWAERSWKITCRSHEGPRSFFIILMNWVLSVHQGDKKIPANNPLIVSSADWWAGTRYSSRQLSLCVKTRFSFGFEALAQTKPQTLWRWKPSHNSPLCFFKEHGVGRGKKIQFGKTRSEDNDSEDEKRQQVVSSGLSSERGEGNKKVEKVINYSKANRSTNMRKTNR